MDRHRTPYLCTSCSSPDLTTVILTCYIQGGSFLYVATVLQPVSGYSGQAEELKATTRVFLIIFGMFVPFIIATRSVDVGNEKYF